MSKIEEGLIKLDKLNSDSEDIKSLRDNSGDDNSMNSDIIIKTLASGYSQSEFKDDEEL